LDLKDAYWQIPFEPSSREKLSFTIPGKPLYQYKVMPFGLTNASQAMTRLIQKVSSKVNRTFKKKTEQIFFSAKSIYFIQNSLLLL